MRIEDYGFIGDLLPETIEDPGLLAALAQLVEEVTEQCWELPPKSA